MQRIGTALSLSKQAPTANTITFDCMEPAPNGIPAEFDRLSPVMQAALKQFAAAPVWPMYLHGEVGRGKTSAAAVVYRAFKGPSFDATGVRCAKGWLSATEAINAVLKARFDDKPQFPRAWENAPICCLDDLGTRALTPAQFDALLWLINTRERKPLIVTSNLSIGRLAAWLEDNRIPSRLAAGYIIELHGEDRRGNTRKRVSA